MCTHLEYTDGCISSQLSGNRGHIWSLLECSRRQSWSKCIRWFSLCIRPTKIALLVGSHGPTMNVYIAKMTVPDPCTAIVPFNHGQSTAAKPKLSPINILRWGGGGIPTIVAPQRGQNSLVASGEFVCWEQNSSRRLERKRRTPDTHTEHNCTKFGGLWSKYIQLPCVSPSPAYFFLSFLLLLCFIFWSVYLYRECGLLYLSNSLWLWNIIFGA